MDGAQPRPPDWLSLVWIAGGVLVILAAIALFAPRRPLDVSVTDAALLIDGTPIDFRSVRGVELLDEEPPMTRVSGLASMTTRRGWYRSDGMGEGQVWVRRRSPPYIRMRTTWGFVVFNLDDPDETRRLHETLSARLPAR